MKKSVTLLVLLCCAALLQAQPFSFKADSLTNVYLKKVPAKQQSVFKTLQTQQHQAATAHRLDSAGYDYALMITEIKPADTAARVWEYYYRLDGIKEHVSMKQQPPVTAILPARYYYNGKKYNTPASFFNSTLMNISFYDLHELYYTLDSVVMRFRSIKPVQELTYDATLATTADTSGGRLKTLAKAEEARLKQTYQLVTLVDRLSGKVIVSLQTPALNPKVRYRYEDFRYWDW
jgi:hypothetical protein